MRTPILTTDHNHTDGESSVLPIHHPISDQILQLLLDKIPNFAFMLRSQKILINKEFRQFLHPAKTDFNLQDILEVIHKDDVNKFKELLNHKPTQFLSSQHQYRIKNNKSEYHWFLVQAKPSLNPKNEIDWLISLIDIEPHYQSHQDALMQIKTQKEMSNQIKKALRISSETDELTGLLNRLGLKNHVKLLFKDHHIHKHIGLFLIGLDHFKNINDTYGYTAGDFILKQFAKRLKKEFYDKSIISRLGSDEFAVVYYGLTDEIDDLNKIANTILNLMHESYDYNGKVLSSNMSIGCAVFPQDADNFSNLLQCADAALNDLKARGRGGIQYFNENMFNITRDKAIQIETARCIIREKSITPYYQPKIELSTLKVIGLEALLRWHCPETNTMFTPETITEAFNDFELSTKISAEMQSKIFADIKTWQTKGKKIIPIAINASPVEFFRDNYAETLLERIDNTGISPELIEVEITEHLFSDRGVEYVIRALKKLQEAGIRVSLDDFGTGHSSLTHLRDLPVNSIKIDYSFIEKITEEKPIAAIVEGIVKLGPMLNMNVIAEGIENQEQLDMLIKMGCPQGQGFLFKDAITAKEVENLLGN